MTLKAKKPLLLLVGILVAAFSIMFFNLSTTKAEEPDVKTIERLFDNYFNAIKAGRVDEIIQYVIDTRYADVQSQREGYKAAAKEDVIYEVKILSITKSQDDTYDVRLAVKNKTNGNFEITLPVVNQNDSWKIRIKPIDIPPAK